MITNIFIETNGDDVTGNGSASAPFATLQRAVSSLQADAQAHIFVGDGTFFFAQPVVLAQHCSQLTITGSGKTVFSGAMPLQNLAWRETDGVFSAQLAKNLPIDRLFVDGQEQVMARFPNRDETQLLGGCTTAAAIKERVAGYQSVAGARVMAMHEHGWGGNSFLVRGKNPKAPHGLELDWVGDNNRGSGTADCMMIENVKEELDAPCEWYYCSKTGALSYIPPASIDMRTAHFAACTNAEILKISGASAVIIENIQFMHTARTMFAGHLPGKAYVPLLRGDWCVVRAGAVFVENASRVQIKGCTFADIGGNALFFYGYNRNHSVVDTEFFSIGACAVQIVGKPESLWEPSFWPHENYAAQPVHKTQVDFPEKIGARTQDFPEDILLENNHIHRVGVYEKQSAGINLSASSRIRILHNTIHDSPRSNINVNDGSFGGHEIAFNDIFDAQRETQDHGPFNSWGRDRFWSVPQYNASGKHGELLRHYEVGGRYYDITQIDAWQTTRIHHNRFHHSASQPHSWGIDLDDGSSNYEIFCNLILGIGIKLREGFDRRVYNNILIGGDIQIHVPYAQCRDVISHNLVVAPKAFGFAGTDEKDFKKTEIRIQNTWHYWPQGAQNTPMVPPPVSVANPQFLNPAENDYTVTNTHAMQTAGFANFDMHAFGQPGCAYRAPVYLLEEIALPGETPKAAVLGMLVSDMDEAALSATASSDKNGIYVLQITQAGAAQKAGILCGDIIREVGGKKVTDCEAFLKILQQATDALLLFRVQRAGTLSELVVQV